MSYRANLDEVVQEQDIILILRQTFKHQSNYSTTEQVLFLFFIFILFYLFIYTEHFFKIIFFYFLCWRDRGRFTHPNKEKRSTTISSLRLRLPFRIRLDKPFFCFRLLHVTKLCITDSTLKFKKGALLAGLCLAWIFLFIPSYFLKLKIIFQKLS